MLLDLLLKTKNKYKKFKETGDSKYIYNNRLDKVHHRHEMAYLDFKDIPRKTVSDEVLNDKAIIIAKNTKYDGYQHGLASMICNSW